MKIEPADLPGNLGDVIGEVEQVLEGMGVRDALIGGLAVGAHARATKERVRCELRGELACIEAMAAEP